MKAYVAGAIEMVENQSGIHTLINDFPRGVSIATRFY